MKKTTKLELFSWMLYDFANTSFTVMVVTFVYAVYFRDVVGIDLDAAVEIMATENEARCTEVLRPSDIEDIVLDDVVLVAVAADPPETDVLALRVDHRIVDDPHTLGRQTAAPGAAPLEQPAPC